jgi:hypothetical protein
MSGVLVYLGVADNEAQGAATVPEVRHSSQATRIWHQSLSRARKFPGRL